MALDSLTIGAIIAELNESLTGSVIEKIRQPDRDMLIFTVRTRAGNKNLLISANTGTSRLHLTELSRENPAHPPMFCMLLRKYLTGAIIKNISRPEGERIAELKLVSRNELGDEADLRLVVELMGKNSNVILVGQDGRILDCLRRLSFAGDSDRCLNPGMYYRYPPSPDKPNFFLCSPSDLHFLAALYNPAEPAVQWLRDNFSGLSPAMLRELEFRVNSFIRQTDSTHPACLEQLLLEFKADTAPVKLKPIVYSLGEKAEFSAFPRRLMEAEGWSKEEWKSFSEMQDSFYASRDAVEHRNRIGRNLSHRVRTNRERLERKLAAQTSELALPDELELLRRRAELVTANIYKIHKGDEAVQCEDYYSTDCPLITIELDPLKTPQQNSSAMYRLYSKKKTAASVLEELMAEERKQLEYLNSVADELTRALTEQDIREISSELAATGWIKHTNAENKKKMKSSAPLEFETESGKKILVGKNNLQNDLLTHKLARRTDYWFHVKSYHGSHVILCCEDSAPLPGDILKAAGLAAQYSQAAGGGKVAVDYTMVRNVKKPSGAYPGNVIYTDYSTVITEA